jgi:hypothetical protein
VKIFGAEPGDEAKADAAKAALKALSEAQHAPVAIARLIGSENQKLHIPLSLIAGAGNNRGPPKPITVLQPLPVTARGGAAPFLVVPENSIQSDSRVRENQRIIRNDDCDRPFARNVCRGSVQVAAPACSGMGGSLPQASFGLGASSSGASSGMGGSVNGTPQHSDQLLVLRLVDVLADERHHVGRTIYAGQSRIKDQLRHPRGRLDFDLEDVRLQRVHEALLE